MSLIVARLVNNLTTGSKDRILVVSDTKLTDCLRNGGGPLSWTDGVVKTSILDKNFAVSWAGVVDYADECLKNFSSNGILYNSRKQIIKFFSDFHISKNKEVEFILTFLNPAEIFEIKNGAIKENCQSSWIGSHQAFSLFQKHMLEYQSSSPYEIVRQMIDSMQNVIDEDACPEVGDFVISIITTLKNEFAFGDRFLSINSSQRLCEGVNEFTIGSAASGSFTMSLNTCRNNINVLALFFNQGNFGLLFIPKDNGILRVHSNEVIKCDSPDDFNKKMRDQFGFDISVCYQ